MTRTWAVLVALAGWAGLARAEDWPGFRGPTGQGVSAEKELPLRWGAGANVAWKAAVPGEGWSSPVASKGRVFLTAATDGGASCRVLCFDAATGKALWDREAHRQAPSRKEGRNSYASSTPAADGRRVYAVWPDGAITALDYDGKAAWANRDVRFYSQHGLGTSPRLYKGLLLVAFDGSSPGPDKKVGWQVPWDQGVLLALDCETGRERWRGRRGASRVSHTTPAVLSVDGHDQIVSNAGDVVQGFDPANGKRLWSVRSEGEGVVPSPVCGGGLVFSTSGFGSPAIRAVRPGDGKGRPAEVVWEQTRSVPMIPSLLYVKPHLFAVSQDGFVQCLEAATGKVLGRALLGGACSASPVWADGKVYQVTEAGETVVLEASPGLKVLARNALGENCKASPAVSGGRLYLRTEKHLYCVGSARE